MLKEIVNLSMMMENRETPVRKMVSPQEASRLKAVLMSEVHSPTRKIFRFEDASIVRVDRILYLEAD
jgi:hypothetical protein